MHSCITGILTVLGLLISGAPRADVFNMGGVQRPDGTWTGRASLEFVPVGCPRNASDMRYNLDHRSNGFGAVDRAYRIGRYEVTAAQYTVFLNAIAATDTFGLYSTSMASDERGCGIQRSGSPGSYIYSVSEDRANRPVNFISWAQAARFVNWLHNGQPTGRQDSRTTEDGAYFLNGAADQAALMAATRTSSARYWIPSEDEWYKAAYYDPYRPGGAAYWDYPTRSDEAPGNRLASFDQTNGANFNHWDGTGWNETIGSPHYRTEVGAFVQSASPWGTFDQGGNVWEWTETAADERRRVLRGGAFIGGPSAHLHASYRANVINPVAQTSFFGLRVAAVAEPLPVLVSRCQEARRCCFVCRLRARVALRVTMRRSTHR